MVRKGGSTPHRSCDRQPLKLIEMLHVSELRRIDRTDVLQTYAAAHACDDFIRTNSHTLR